MLPSKQTSMQMIMRTTSPAATRSASRKRQMMPTASRAETTLRIVSCWITANPSQKRKAKVYTTPCRSGHWATTSRSDSIASTISVALSSFL